MFLQIILMYLLDKILFFIFKNLIASNNLSVPTPETWEVYSGFSKETPRDFGHLNYKSRQDEYYLLNLYTITVCKISIM